MIPAIEIEDLAIYGARRCLLNVEHLEVPAQKVVAIMGPNGAGKTTLLRACLGLVKPARGNVRVLGCSLDRLQYGPMAQLRSRIGYVSQLLPAHCDLPLTVREVAAIGRTARAGLFRSLNREDWSLVDEWIDKLGLAGLAGRLFSQISGGEQRKTIIARAMAQQPELLILDEPTANLDLGWRERLVETVQQLHTQTGISTVLVCHELEVLPPACRTVVALNQGRVVACGTPENVFTPERVAALYGPGLRVVHDAGRHTVVPECRHLTPAATPLAPAQGGPHA